jgi:hypothetical protein
MSAAIGGVVGETVGKGGVRGGISVNPTPQGLSRPGKAIYSPTTRSGLCTGLQGRRIDQAGRYGLVTGFLLLRALCVPGGGISEAGAYIGHQVADRAKTGKHPLDVGIEVGEEAMCLGSVGYAARTISSRGRRVGGRVELGRVEFSGRGIAPVSFL